MKKKWYKILFVFAAVNFILTATNIVLLVHLYGHNEHEHHDHRNCPTCQQASINKNPAVLFDTTKITLCCDIFNEAVYVVSSFSQIADHQLPCLRAPPTTL